MKLFRIFLSAVLAFLLCSTHAHGLTVSDLRVETRTNPEGIDGIPSFSWKLLSEERGIMQTSYRIVVATDAAFGNVVWDSGTQTSDQSVGVKGEGLNLKPSTRYYWKVSVSDNKNNEATSDELAYFDTGLMDSGWNGAMWIQASNVQQGESSAQTGSYTVEAKFEIAHTAAGICFAQQDASNFYMWQFNTEGSVPRFRPHRWSGGNAACLANVDLTGKVNLQNDHEYSVRIEVSNNGKHAATYLEGILIDERDGDFSFGRIGIREDRGETDQKAEIAYFDDFKVSDENGKVLFAEDFSSTNSFSAGMVVDGRLYVVGSSTNTVYAWQKSSLFLHYTVEADMTLLQANAAIVFGATSPNTYFMWQMNTADTDHTLLRHHVYVDGKLSYNDVAISQFSKADLLQHCRHLKIEVNGSTITTSIDGTVIDSYDDVSGALAFGDVGFRVHNNPAGAVEQAYFDNLLVTRYDEEGISHVVMNETMDGGTADFFYDADIVEVDGNWQIYAHALPNQENRLMQESANGIPMFRKAFTLSKQIKTAKLYSSALGIYDVFINGQRVGHTLPDGQVRYEELKPGWTDYRSRVFYLSHDVTTLLQQGQNAIGAHVASGWWAGAVSHGIYGSPSLAFMAKLVVTYEDNTTETLGTDLSWVSSCKGALRSGEIYDGEIYDARMETAWTQADFDQTGWNAVEMNTDFKGTVECFKGPDVVTLDEERLTPVSATVYQGTVDTGTDYGAINIVAKHNGGAPLTIKKGESVIFDFGQNFAGWIDFKVKGQVGSRMHVRFAEMLNDTGESSRANDGPGGSLYLISLRSAKAQLYYTLAGREEGESYHPSTTFYGFRYCEITPTDDIELLALQGVPITSSSADNGQVNTSHDMVNRLFSNIRWGQRSNLISIPTDCPQRDERLGWTADTQVFSRTAAYNSDVNTFYRKWMTDMRDGQREDGAYPNVAPFNWVGYGASAWADAGIVLPWNVYLMYGDKEIIRENYASMEKYMDWLSTQTGDGYLYQGASTEYGDWLAFADTDRRYISVAYYAHDADLMAKMAHVLSNAPGDEFDLKATKYSQLFADIKAEFHKRYFEPNIRQTTQTAYLLALGFDLIDDADERASMAARLSTRIRLNGEKLNTGFVGTAIINQTLSEVGLTDKAYNLLLQRQCPSWLYSIDQGATTMWERWNSYTIESGFGDWNMNSFNHYAYGAVGEWMYRFMAGIETTEDQPGFKHIVLQPCPDERTTLPDGQEKITFVNATHNSPYGTILSHWTTETDGTLSYHATVPANTTATLRLPVADNAKILESGQPVEEAEGVVYLGISDGVAEFTLGSGKYHFTLSGGTGVTEITSDNRLQVIPNPTSTSATVSCGDQPIVRLQLFDTAGNRLQDQTSSCERIDLSSYAPGTYILKATTATATQTAKIVKSN